MKLQVDRKRGRESESGLGDDGDSGSYDSSDRMSESESDSETSSGLCLWKFSLSIYRIA